jgi:hypothetical protein
MPTTVLTFYVVDRRLRLFPSLIGKMDVGLATIDGFKERERERVVLTLVAMSPVKFVEE